MARIVKTKIFEIDLSVLPSLSKKSLSQPQLAAIGSIAVESSYIESLLGELIIDFSGINENKLALFMRGKMMEGKLDLAKELAAIAVKGKKMGARFSNLISRLKAANSDRVHAIHGLWMHTQEDMEKKRLGLLKEDPIALGKHPRNALPMSADKLEKIATELSHLYWELLFFSADFDRERGKLPPLPKQRPPHQSKRP